MMAVANPVRSTEARPRPETNDRTQGVSADVSQAVDTLPLGPVVAVLGLFLIGAAGYAWRRHRNALAARRLLHAQRPGVCPEPPAPSDPALTVEGSALLLWLQSRNPAPAALPAAAATPGGSRRPEKECPYCGERILAAAAECVHCGEFFDRRVGERQPG